MSKEEIIIKETPLGYGVFAPINFAADKIVGEVLGAVLTDDDYGSDYCIDLGDDARMEPAAPFRFLNHSCEPNCELVLWKTRKRAGRVYSRLWVQSIRPITTGEELTIDYGWTAEVAIPCQCRSEKCRGWIVHADELHLLPMGTLARVSEATTAS